MGKRAEKWHFRYALIFIGRVVLTIVWIYVFFNSGFIDDETESITLFLATMGITFGVTQFAYGQIRQSERAFKELRFSEFKEIRKSLSKVSESLNIGVGSTLELSTLQAKLMDASDALHSFLNEQDKLLFPGIGSKDISKKIKNQVDNIVALTDEITGEIVKIYKEWEEAGNFSGRQNLDIKTQKRIRELLSEWLHKIDPKLDKFHVIKHHFMSELGSYLT